MSVSPIRKPIHPIERSYHKATPWTSKLTDTNSPEIMPTHETTKRLRHEEKVAREQLVGHLPASIINTHFDTEKGYRNTRAVRAALAYIKELEAANLRLEVENGWLAEDVEELEEKLEESKLQNGVLQELLEKRTRVSHK